MLAIDTNIVIRYLTGDDPVQSAKARALIDRQDVYVVDTVMLEAEWVLRSSYGFDRTDAIAALRAFAGLPTVTLENPDVVGRAIALAMNGMDFADALHLMHSRPCDGFATFDRSLVKTAATLGVKNVALP
ncbi:hypothetical protein FACS1894205_1950 [Alphaproteobacteria bacterium]|nr:hypothetical protein FACS1894205_1950 [Alphaproteobacteria bacterium]